jgi:exosome complex component RRP4
MSKRIVVPGELISEERKRLGSNVFVANGKIYAKVLGVSDVDKDQASVVPLEGKYLAKPDDVVIGVVTRVVFAGYGINLNACVDSFIPTKAMRDQLRVGDIVMAKVESVDELKEADLIFPRRLIGGEVFEVVPVRSPRLIGKNGSMLELLKRGTGCELIIGKNGRIWARNGNIELLKKVIAFIEENAYKSNLTNAIQDYFGITLEEKIPFNQQVNNKNVESEIISEESEVIDYSNEGELNE